MIEKQSVFITSLGRTGTKFFQKMLSAINPQYTVLHEPDYINYGQYSEMGERLTQLKKQISTIGIDNLLFWNLILKSSMVELSDLRLKGKLSMDSAKDGILKRREHFITNQPGEIYIESSSAYYGLIDVLGSAFSDHRVLFIARNGKNWVQSKMNFGNMYQKGLLRSMVSHTWPRSIDIQDDPYQTSWDSMSRFDKICWSWRTLNDYAINTIGKNPDAKLVRFEDIFVDSNRKHYIQDLLEFMFPSTNVDQTENIQKYLQYFDNKIHASTKKFPSWTDWTHNQKDSFNKICGPLMEDLKY